MMAVYPPPNAVTNRLVGADKLSQLRPAFTNEISSNVEPAVIVAPLKRGSSRQLDGALGDLDFGAVGLAGERFDCTAIAIASAKIHLGIYAGWILPQHLLHAAEVLKDLPPIQHGQLPQAGERVANGDLIFRLA